MFLKSVEVEDTTLKSWKDKKLALWFVSNCVTPIRRENFVQELVKYVDIDVYGGSRCKIKDYSRDPCKSSICKKKLYSSYKFYLSFENTKCDYYITEKYYKLYEPDMIFSVDIVPIVMGPSLEDYLRVAPDNHSFIFAEAFDSPKSLADYLIYLDSNQTAYNEYFKWKDELKDRLMKLSVEFNRNASSVNLISNAVRANPFCQLCERLHDTKFLESNNEIIKISELYNPLKNCNNTADPKSSELWNILKKRSCNS